MNPEVRQLAFDEDRHDNPLEFLTDHGANCRAWSHLKRNLYCTDAAGGHLTGEAYGTVPLLVLRFHPEEPYVALYEATAPAGIAS